MIQKPKGFAQDCVVLFNGEEPQPLIMWVSSRRIASRTPVYRVTQQWLEKHKVAEEHTLYLKREELEQLLQAAENYETQGAQGGGA